MRGKAVLEELSKKQELEISRELDRISEKGSHLITNTLFIVGGLTLTYTLFKIIVGEKSVKEKKKKEHNTDLNSANNNEERSAFSEITKTLTESAVLFLLAMAKEKLSEYLNSQDEHSK